MKRQPREGWSGARIERERLADEFVEVLDEVHAVKHDVRSEIVRQHLVDEAAAVVRDPTMWFDTSAVLQPNERRSTMSKLALFGAALLAATSFAHARVHHAVHHAHARVHHAAFHAVPAPQLTGFTGLECSIVRENPKPRDDKNPVYKINVSLTKDDSGNFESFDVIHTLRSGKLVDRSEQYSGANIWQTKGRLEFFWKGYRGENQMVGTVYHNDRDGWMYRETISAGGRVAYEMLADCHKLEDGD